MDRETQEYELLRILEKNPQPMGSSTLSNILKLRDIDISSATVGRMLSNFDLQGLTKRQGYKGRVLTESGQTKLSEYKRKLHLEEISMNLYESVNETGHQNLIDILVARRGIEREIAGLAALNATREDIENIEAAYHMHYDSVEYGKYGRVSSEHDVSFHRAIAKASKNKVLAAAYDFIWQNGRFSPIMEYVRVSVGGTIAVDHGKILESIAARDVAESQNRMVAHIDSMIRDANNYWHEMDEKKGKQHLEMETR